MMDSDLPVDHHPPSLPWQLQVADAEHPLKTQLAAQAEEIAALKKENMALRSQLGKQASRTREDQVMRTTYPALKRANEEFRRRITERDTALAAERKKVTELQQKGARTAEQLRHHEKHEQQLAELRQQNAHLDASLAVARNQGAELQTQLDASLTAAHEADAAQSQLEAAHATANGMIVQLVQTINAQRDSVAEHKQLLSSLQKMAREEEAALKETLRTVPTRLKSEARRKQVAAKEQAALAVAHRARQAAEKKMEEAAAALSSAVQSGKRSRTEMEEGAPPVPAA